MSKDEKLEIFTSEKENPSGFAAVFLKREKILLKR